MNAKRWASYLVFIGVLSFMSAAHPDYPFTITSPGQPAKSMTQVDHATELAPPCRSTISDGFVEFQDSKSQQFDLQVKDRDIISESYPTVVLAPGGPDDLALLGLLKQWLKEHYNPSLEEHAEFPYVLGHEGECSEQLAAQHLVRLLQKRIETKTKVDPESIELLPHESQRRQVAGLKLLGPDWQEVSSVSELHPPCTFLAVDELMFDWANFQFVLADSQRHLLRVGYGEQKLFLGRRQMEHPGDEEESKLEKIVGDAYQKIYDSSLDVITVPTEKWQAWQEQRLLRMALKVLELRRKTKAEVPDQDLAHK